MPTVCRWNLVNSTAMSMTASRPELVVRPSASIVILAWNAWPVTRDCLESLRSTLALGDEVIVVDNGSHDDTGALLAANPWVKTFTNPTNRGFAGGNNDGARHATGEVLVFLNNDTVPVGNWLDRLLAPFNDPTVVATGPRSNFVSGPQMVEDTDYMVNRLAGLKGFVHQWEAEHNGHVEPLSRLVGFCLAVRRSVYEAIGGFDEAFVIGGFEDDDLCRRLAAHGQLLMVHDAYVHHHGHVSFDANGLDWAAIERQNRQTFIDKHGAAAPKVAIASVVIDQRVDPGLDAHFQRRGAQVVRCRIDDALTAVEAVPGRAELVVAAPESGGLARCDVPSVLVGAAADSCADMLVGADEDPSNWVGEVYEALASQPIYGALLLAARRQLDAGNLGGAIDAALAADELRPGTAPAAVLLGLCAMAGGAIDDARGLFEIAVAGDPGHPTALAMLEQLGAAK